MCCFSLIALIYLHRGGVGARVRSCAVVLKRVCGTARACAIVGRNGWGNLPKNTEERRFPHTVSSKRSKIAIIFRHCLTLTASLAGKRAEIIDYLYYPLRAGSKHREHDEPLRAPRDLLSWGDRDGGRPPRGGPCRRWPPLPRRPCQSSRGKEICSAFHAWE